MEKEKTTWLYFQRMLLVTISFSNKLHFIYLGKRFFRCVHNKNQKKNNKYIYANSLE